MRTQEVQPNNGADVPCAGGAPRSGGILGAAPGGGRGSQVGQRLIGEPFYGGRMIRPLEHQFPVPTVRRIQQLVLRLRSMRYPEGASRYYGLDLAHALESGALLSALNSACTLLEVMVRGLVVHLARPVSARKLNLERELESLKHVRFGHLVDALLSEGLLAPEVSDRAKSIYLTVRIPIQHGLSQRFVQFHEDSWSLDIRELLRHGKPISASVQSLN